LLQNEFSKISTVEEKLCNVSLELLSNNNPMVGTIKKFLIN
jgi:hypothetical protein